MYYAGYRRGRGGYIGGDGRPRPTTIATNGLPPDRELDDGLEKKPIKTLSKPTDSSGKDIVIKQLEYLGSYNWTNETKPTILVPGSPAQWRDRCLPYRVQPDSGIKFVDQNGYRMPSSTLYPLFRAVDIMTEENGNSIDWRSVDFITDRNGLRKLLRWINDTDGSAKEFRIDTQLAGTRTVLLNRWEKRTREAGNPQWTTYGFSFERASTNKVKGCERGTGHHRVVKYDFDGLTLVVRFEVDAFIATSPSRGVVSSSSNIDSLSDMLSGLNVATATSDSMVDSTASTAELDVIRTGSEVPHSSLIEMTTRSRRNAENYDWGDAYPQLYLSQTRNHYLAVHNRGEFETITKRAVDDAEMKRFDRSAQNGFKKLRRVLETIQELVVEHGQRGRLSLVHRDGQLQVFDRIKRDGCLPEDMLRCFED
ncbi:uncharacterized protein LAESUDRAFT_809076 [Laetiporus sulphureus 93-53]|uniref:Geranylgeranyl pyrophosphate synthetase n=1 Tax=Laetiporus sulphureus 93-53 TaxID=1314785 RepID=A0A165HVY6_9APHY|nr:uncharacterized protein LAESUDRAFT_809076 [Laetiporus sulphureus 93-53]KZT12263.1 hypothetical protein LAESUDRAFT_809076 [Laetiporus sulphureus 93-53]